MNIPADAIAVPSPATIAGVLAAELPGLAPEDADRDWVALGLDSFGLLTLRAAVEQAIERDLGDREWQSATTPRRLCALDGASSPRAQACAAEDAALAGETILGMPELAMGGLSESWLLKRLGHVHWQMIGVALGVAPQLLCDEGGRRLYPAITRVRFVSSRPLGRYREGERLGWTSRLSRFGGSLFFSRTVIAGEDGRGIEAEMMSSFALRVGAGNEDLARGKPVGVEAGTATALDAMPAFGTEHQAVRARIGAEAPVIARATYDVVPQHDINGVGLLYFAAYPIIADICEMREPGRVSGTGRGRWAAGSTIARDVHYFANADADAGLEWRLHRAQAGDAPSEASIIRDDGTAMAAIFTRRDIA